MHTLKQLTTRTRVEGLVILLVAAGYLWETNNVPEFYQLPDAPGPTTFPYLLGAVFALVGLWLLISPNELRFKDSAVAGAASAPADAEPAAAPAAPSTGGWLRRVVADWHFYAIWAVILCYLWLMPLVGFPVTTVVLLAAFVWLLGETRWHIVLAYALITTIVVYVSFKAGLNVRLPLGILEPMFK